MPLCVVSATSPDHCFGTTSESAQNCHKAGILGCQYTQTILSDTVR